MDIINLTLLFVIALSVNFLSVYANESNFVQLLPTDDAYVIVDTTNPDHPVTEFNTGDYNNLKIAYFFNATGTEENLISLGHLKFDLSELNLNEIKSATLNLNVISYNLKNNTLSVFKAAQYDWDESSLTFANKPAFNPTPIDVANSLSPTNWIQWNVTDAIKQHNSTDITFVISLNKIKPNSEEEINFHSKESNLPETSPFLEVELVDLTQIPKQPDYTVKELFVMEDAYVVNNYNDPQDQYQLQTTNTGNLNFTKILYSNNFTGNNEFITSIGFLKFDLSELNPEKIIDAKLQMFNTGVQTSNADKIISISTVSNNTWNESDLNFANKPEFIQEIAFAEINNVNDWISWNVTDIIKENAGSEITLRASYSKFYLGHQEQTVFASKESGKNIPYLEIVYDEPNGGGGCLIATATYGSELAPQVQMLREIRDNSLLQTQSGKSFMQGFNEFYYSFSPAVADYERQNPVFKEAVKVTITPLLASLSILNHVDIDSEESVLGYGLSIIALNVGIYVVSPVVGLKIVKKLLCKKKIGV